MADKRPKYEAYLNNTSGSALYDAINPERGKPYLMVMVNVDTMMRVAEAFYFPEEAAEWAEARFVELAPENDREDYGRLIRGGMNQRDWDDDNSLGMDDPSERERDKYAQKQCTRLHEAVSMFNDYWNGGTRDGKTKLFMAVYEARQGDE